MTSATIAAAAVNAAVSMKKLEAPDGEAKTYIVKDAARKVFTLPQHTSHTFAVLLYTHAHTHIRTVCAGSNDVRR